MIYMQVRFYHMNLMRCKILPNPKPKAKPRNEEDNSSYRNPKPVISPRQNQVYTYIYGINMKSKSMFVVDEKIKCPPPKRKRDTSHRNPMI